MNRHNCESVRDGDWIIFTCPRYPGYKRKINWRTHKMSVENDVEDITHYGREVVF